MVKLEIGITLDNPAWANAVPEVRSLVRSAATRAVAMALGDAPAQRLELGVTLTDDRRVRALNRVWRGIDRPTNVLSFPIGAAPGPGPRLLGDVVVALETLLAEAERDRKTPAQHLSHLIVHGVLHLLGYDHEIDAEAEIMEALERKALATLGVADPYRDRAATASGR